MNKEEKRTAAEQLARNRTVRGWAFKELPAEENDAIREFLRGGPIPEKFMDRYLRERENLMLGAKDWYEAFADAAIGLVGVDGWKNGMCLLTTEQEAYCERAADSIATRPKEEQ